MTIVNHRVYNSTSGISPRLGSNPCTWRTAWQLAVSWFLYVIRVLSPALQTSLSLLAISQNDNYEAEKKAK
jgi:hypothetical protein